MGIEMIKSVVGNKGLSGYKNMGKILDDVEGYILKAMNRGAKSKYCLGTEQTLFGYEQTYKRNGKIIKKMYQPQQGRIDTAVFSGDKAKIIEKDSYYRTITQPDKLVSQSWCADNAEPIFNEHVLAVTTPIEQATPSTIERGIHLKQQTKLLKVDQNEAYYEEYPSYLDSGSWFGQFPRYR